MAIAPPCWLTIAGSSSGHSRRQASDCAAKASLSSTAAMSPQPMPARRSAVRAASTGPIPYRCGSTPLVARLTIRAIGVAFDVSNPRCDITNMAAAPSFIGDAFPAVTVPPCLNTGFSLPSESIDESGRMHSSRSSGASATCTVSAAKCPASQAAAARWCEPMANASCSSREIEYLSANTSAPSPSEMVHSPGIFGFTIRQPSAEFHICSCVVGYAFDGFNTTHGARVMLSTPQAIVMSASPTATVRDAPKIASMPLPHNRLTVAAGIVVGNPASSSAMRPTLRLSSPAPLASPA